MDSDNSLADTLFTGTQQAIFWLLFPDPQKTYHLRGIVNTTGLGMGAVQRELRRLTEAGILIREELRSQVLFRANFDHPAYTDLRNLIMRTLDIEQTAEPPRRKQTGRKTSRGVSLRLRFLVMRRDGFKCVQCGRSPATDLRVVLEVDHKLAWTKSGESELENLQTLCKECNAGKSNL